MVLSEAVKVIEAAVVVAVTGTANQSEALQCGHKHLYAIMASPFLGPGDSGCGNQLSHNFRDMDKCTNRPGSGSSFSPSGCHFMPAESGSASPGPFLRSPWTLQANFWPSSRLAPP